MTLDSFFPKDCKVRDPIAIEILTLLEEADLPIAQLYDKLGLAGMKNKKDIEAMLKALVHEGYITIDQAWVRLARRS